MFDGLDERHGRRGRAHIAVLLDREKYLVRVRARTFGDRLDDAQVGLVRHDQRDVVHRHAGAVHDIETGFAHALHRFAEYLLAVEVPAGLSELHAQIRVHGAHAAHPEDVAGIGVALQLLGDHARFVFRLLQHHRRGAVAEQHGHVAVIPVQVLRDQFDADDERVLDDAALDHG